jgi:adenylate kinase family enzyme
MRLVVLGGSWAGKSTQAPRLGKFFNVPLVSTGETLREAIYGNSQDNIPILEYYDHRHRLLTINGDQSPEQVQQNILTLLG